MFTFQNVIFGTCFFQHSEKYYENIISFIIISQYMKNVKKVF